MRILTIGLLLSIAWAHGDAAELHSTEVNIARLQAKADHAPPNERCFLYAELVSLTTEVAAQQFRAEDSAHGEETLRLVQRYVLRLHASVGNESKKLKLAEAILRQTCFRLDEILHELPNEDRPAWQMAIQQVTGVRMQLMMQVFHR